MAIFFTIGEFAVLAISVFLPNRALGRGLRRDGIRLLALGMVFVAVAIAAEGAQHGNWAMIAAESGLTLLIFGMAVAREPEGVNALLAAAGRILSRFRG